MLVPCEWVSTEKIIQLDDFGCPPFNQGEFLLFFFSFCVFRKGTREVGHTFKVFKYLNIDLITASHVSVRAPQSEGGMFIPNMFTPDGGSMIYELVCEKRSPKTPPSCICERQTTQLNQMKNTFSDKLIKLLDVWEAQAVVNDDQLSR